MTPFFINCTPHDIFLNDGRVSLTSGNIARVSSSFTDMNDYICHVTYGNVENLPDPKDGVFYIVSPMVLAASDRKDLVTPATDHPDCIRDDKGHIISVPGFVQK